MKKKYAILITLTCAVLLSSCTRYIVTPLPLPPEPELPKLTLEEAEAMNEILTEEIRQKLGTREALLKNDNQTLRDIIRSTH